MGLDWGLLLAGYFTPTYFVKNYWPDYYWMGFPVVYGTTPSIIVYTKRYWDEMKRRSPIPGILPRQRWVRYKP